MIAEQPAPGLGFFKMCDDCYEQSKEDLRRPEE